jgi:hypothetical protein
MPGFSGHPVVLLLAFIFEVRERRCLLMDGELQISNKLATSLLTTKNPELSKPTLCSYSCLISRIPSLLALRGGSGSRAKRPPPKAIGEERLLRIIPISEPASLLEDSAYPVSSPQHPAKILSSQEDASSIATNTSQPQNQGDNATSSEEDSTASKRNETSPAPSGTAEERELAELRASVMRRLAALFPIGVNITALALDDEQSASSLAVLHREILRMQQWDEEELRDASPAGDFAARCSKHHARSHF